MTTLVPPCATLPSQTLAPPPAASAERRVRPAGAGLLVAGLACVVGATFAMFATEGTSPAKDAASPAPAPAPASVPTGPLAFTLSGPGDVSVVSQVYEPGHSSGWHSHPGVHAVAVLSGAITVYDAQCRPQVVAPGSPYIGGQERHLVRNEGDAAVEMVVTYISPSAPGNSTVQHEPPAGCKFPG